MWFLPTHDRPKAIERLMNSPGGMPPASQVIAIYSEDSPALPEYLATWPFAYIMAPAGARFAEKVNLILEKYPSEPFYGLIFDDNEPITPRWWEAMEQAAANKFVAVANVPPRGTSLVGGVMGLGGDLVREMGCLAFPGCRHNFADNFIERVAIDFDLIRTLPAVHIAHHHWRFDQSVAKDACYLRGEETYDQDRAAYQTWLGSDHRKQMADRVAKFLDMNVLAMDLSDKHLCICVPYHDFQMDWAFKRSMQETIKIASAYGLKITMCEVGGGSNVGKARERLLWMAMEGLCTHIMFVDSDMGWDGRVPIHLVASDHDFVAAVGVKKMEELQFACNFYPGHQTFHPRTSFLKVPEVGFGLVVFKREVVETMCDAYPDLVYDKDGGGEEHALFIEMIDAEPDGRRTRLSEDLSFCRRWTKIGGEIYVDPQIALIHAGRREYTGRIADMFNFEAQKLEAAE